MERLRQKKGPVWILAKRGALKILSWHIPVGTLGKPVFRSVYGLHVFARESIQWLLRFFYYEPLFRSRCDSVGPGFYMERLPYLPGKGRLVMGSNVRLSGKSTFGLASRFGLAPELIVGDNTFIGHDCSLHIARRITIGAHCFIAGGVRMADFDGHPLTASDRREHKPTPIDRIRPICIEDDVWIGHSAIILKGVTIHRGAIVAAGSIVSRDVPSYTIVAGNPAAVRRRVEEDPSG